MRKVLEMLGRLFAPHERDSSAEIAEGKHAEEFALLVDERTVEQMKKARQAMFEGIEDLAIKACDDDVLAYVAERKARYARLEAELRARRRALKRRGVTDG